MKKIFIYVLFMLGITGVLVFVLSVSSRDKMCRKTLLNIWCVIELHRETHNGSYPLNLNDMADGLARSVLYCPAVRNRKENAVIQIKSNVDYVYIKYSNELSGMTNLLPSQSPIVYDAKLSNHKGKGINILFLDGSVLWDENAAWLKRFAVNHTNLSLPLPVDMP